MSAAGPVTRRERRTDRGGGARAFRGSGGTTEIATDIEPKHASIMSGNPPVDALGYSTVAPLPSPVSMSFRGLGNASTQAWSTDAVDLADSLGGTLHTGFIVSGARGSLALVWCSDAATAASALPTACELFEAPPRRSPNDRVGRLLARLPRLQAGG